MIHIPKRVKIGPVVYAVKALNGDEDEDYWGRHDFGDLEIRIKMELESPQLDIVYLHEVIHAMAEVYMGRKLVEAQVKQFSFALYDFLTRNKIFDE